MNMGAVLHCVPAQLAIACRRDQLFGYIVSPGGAKRSPPAGRADHTPAACRWQLIGQIDLGDEAAGWVRRGSVVDPERSYAAPEVLRPVIE
jgi:hypothetical protein